MSLLVPWDPSDPEGPEAALERRVRRRRISVVGGALLGLLGLAAWPLWAQRDLAELQDRAAVLRQALEAGLAEDQALTTWEQRRLPQLQPLVAVARPWLEGDEEPLALRTRLISLAERCGLTVEGVSLPAEAPSGGPAPGGTVLGRDLDEATLAEGPPVPLATLDLVLDLRGRLSRLLMLICLLGEGSRPLRLASLDLTAEGPEVMARLVVQRLRPSGAAEETR